MKKIYYQQSLSNYEKALLRLERGLQSGRFASYSRYKKQQTWKRLCRYANQLGIRIKASLVAACMAAGLCFTTPASAQTFQLKTGPDDPFNGINAGTSAMPAFVDIDHDGDADVFIGLADGTIAFYKNTGTANAPVFTLQTGAANPFNGVDVGRYATPAFVDIDNDGDMDAFIGEYGGGLSFYKNTGTATVPVFTLVTGPGDPFNGINMGDLPDPTFVDIDHDGDMDAVIGNYYGDLLYYKNTGTPSAPAFTLETGGASPFNGLFAGYYSTPAFVDIDGDGDYDLFVGQYSGQISYFKNVGTASSPVFTQQTGGANPLNAVSVAQYSAPAFWDIDGDGDEDAFIGADDGTITFYQNTMFNLPLHLLSFTGIRQAGYNELQWSTAEESNTKFFGVEESNDGFNFIEIASVNAVGNGNNQYSVKDDHVYSGKVFYRLKMTDIDGKFTYSPVIWINVDLSGFVSIFPDPVKDVINMNIGNGKLLKTRAGIYDANGRLLQNVLLSNYQLQINAQSFSKGIYVIKFADGSARTFMKE